MPDESDKNDDGLDMELESESDADMGAAAAAAAKIKRLKEKLKECEVKGREYLDGWQRERANFANFRMEEEKKKLSLLKLANENLILEILPVLDSFELALADKEAWRGVDSNWRLGVESIRGQLIRFLEKNLVFPIGELPEFNPEYHHSVESVETKKEAEDGKIVETIQKGYTLAGKIIRPALVKVYKFKS